MTEELLLKLQGPNERVGCLTLEGEIVEFENICESPQDGFDISGFDCLKLIDIATATWHTHPNQNANLSVEDEQTFLRWPNLKHYIVGTDGVRCFRVERGKVVPCEA